MFWCCSTNPTGGTKIYVHCMGHSLNLAVQDTSCSVKVMADTFDTVIGLAKVFKYSAKKKLMLLKLKIDLSPGNKTTVSYLLESTSRITKVCFELFSNPFSLGRDN